MEVLGAVASISQLVSYSFSVSKLLVQLAKDLTETDLSAHRHKVNDIQALEKLITGLFEPPVGFQPAQEELLIALVIRISTTACRIRTLLNKLRTFSLTAIWAFPVTKAAVDEELNNLNVYKDTLSLYLLQDIRCVMYKRLQKPDNTMGGCNSKSQHKPQAINLQVKNGNSTAAIGAVLQAGVVRDLQPGDNIIIDNKDNFAQPGSVLHVGSSDSTSYVKVVEEVQKHGHEHRDNWAGDGDDAAEDLNNQDNRAEDWDNAAGNFNHPLMITDGRESNYHGHVLDEEVLGQEEAGGSPPQCFAYPRRYA